jgi:hypothetical protein
MLLEIPWLDRHRPRVEFGPARLFHPKDYDSIKGIRRIIDHRSRPPISEAYCDLAEAFCPSKAWELPPYRDDDLTIDLESGAELSLKPIYELSTLDMEAAKRFAYMSGTAYRTGLSVL